MKKIFSLSLFLFLFISNTYYSQSNSSKSYVVLEKKVQLSEADQRVIDATNFDEYRFYTIRKKIQITRGPLIELLSVKELEMQGVVFPSSTLDLVKSKSENFKHEIINVLDLGIGISPISGRE